MKRYRKKPLTIKAIKFKDPQRVNELDIIMKALNAPEVLYVGDGEKVLRFIIPTLQGEMVALPGDYIIRGIKGELYPCKPDIFEATYEEVKD